jgi:hypothetical protein
MIFDWFRWVFRTALKKGVALYEAWSQRQVAAFCKDRSRQSDDQFLEACELPPDPEAARVALAVRRAVANIGKVDPEFICADDEYPDQLGLLPVWDSMDWTAFTIELENQLGTRLCDDGMHLAGMRVSVKQMAADIYRLLMDDRAPLAPRLPHLR